MKIINHKQGSPEWLAHRKTTHNASDYPVAQGVSKHRSRTKLLISAATGIEQEFSDWQEKILANGQRIEILARPMAEAIIGEDLYPVVATSDDGYLGASSDGATMTYDIGFECKQWNVDLAESVANGVVPKTHVGQLDQQVEVFGFEKILFMVTDGTPENCVYCWYVSSPEARAAIRPTWAQFDEDAANYQPEVIEAKPILTANPLDNLPALVIEVTGRVTHSNLVEFKAAATAVISSIKTELVTDQDFVDATGAVKYLKDVEDNAKRAKQNALDQTTSIAELHRALDEVSKMAGEVRRALEKKIVEEKDRRKAEIVLNANQELVAHIMKMNERIGAAYMPRIDGGFAEAVKGLKSLDSMKDKVSTALANAKIECNAVADRIDSNIKSLEGEGHSWRFMFPDLAAVCTKQGDDFAALLASRIASHKEAEAKRLEAEREKIRAEEQAKAEAAAAAKVAAEKAEQDRIAAEEIRRLDAERKAKEMEESSRLAAESAPACVEQSVKSETQQALSIIGNAQASANDCLTRITLGEICTRLGFTVSAAFLATLGFDAITEKNAKLYNEASFPVICRCISEHTLRVGMTKKAA